MNLQNMTQKSAEAIRVAQNIALEHGNQDLREEHLLLSLLSADGGLIPSLFEKMGVATQALHAACENAVEKLPKISGVTNDRIYLSGDLDRAVTAAEGEAKKMKDAYVSVEHLVLGLFAHPNAAVKKLFDEYDVEKNAFLEALRTHKLLKPETLSFMTTDRLSEAQRETYWTKETHGYGLGVRCPNGKEKNTDFGWGGAACSYLAVDMENEISLFFGAHVLSSPAQGLRTKVYRFVREEILGSNDFDSLYKELEKIENYKLTY